MKSRTFAVVTIVCLLSAGLMARAEEKVQDSRAEARQKVLAEIKRSSLSSTAGDAMTLRILVEAAKCKRGVEVGVAFGYGAINMGIGFERNGGQLTSLEIDPKMVQAARENIKKAELDKTCTVIEGDALKSLPALEGEYDFIFIDALKRDYLKYFQAIAPKLKVGAIVVADNVIKSARDMKDFLDFMQTNRDYDTVIIRASMEKDDGMLVAYKKK
jgi:predicted O-methyltransferase YrrM